MLVIRTRKRIKKQAVLAVTYLTTESVAWSPVEVFLEKTCCCQVRASLGMLPFPASRSLLFPALWDVSVELKVHGGLLLAMQRKFL